MKKIITICFLLIGVVSLSAMQQTTLDKRGVEKHQNYDERLTKVEDYLQIDNHYYEHLSTYNANMYFVGDFLYWTAENEGFASGSRRVTPRPTQGFEALLRGFEYGPGFRVGLGFKPPIDWDMFLSWTRFHHTTKKTFSGGEMNMYNSPVGEISKFSSTWKLRYDILDLELGRAYHLGQTFSLRTHVGLRGGWIKQRGQNIATELYEFDPADGVTVPFTVTYVDKTWIIGPRAGFDVELFFSKNYGFSIYGNLSGALVYGKTDSVLDLHVLSYPGLVNTQLLDLQYNDKQDLLANLQCAIGLSWGDFLTDDENVALRIKAGWEANYWWDQFQNVEYVFFGGISNVDDNTSFQRYNEALLLQGFVLSARLDF